MELGPAVTVRGLFLPFNVVKRYCEVIYNISESLTWTKGRLRMDKGVKWKGWEKERKGGGEDRG